MFLTTAQLETGRVRAPLDTDGLHRLVWTLFSTGREARDFLFRQTECGVVMLSARPPLPSRRFRMETVPWRPLLNDGDRPGFSLRVNATISPRGNPGGRRRADIVMHRMRGATGQAGTLAQRRLEAAREVGPAWLTAQGRRAGFAVFPGEITVKGYGVMRSQRPGGPDAVFGVIDFAGTLEVTDADLLAAAIPGGFGRARAFGCGLLLLNAADPPD